MPDCIKIMYNYLVKYVVDDHTSDIPSNNKQQYRSRYKRSTLILLTEPAQTFLHDFLPRSLTTRFMMQNHDSRRLKVAAIMMKPEDDVKLAAAAAAAAQYQGATDDVPPSSISISPPTPRNKLVLPILTPAMQQDIMVQKGTVKSSKPLSIGARPEFADYPLQGIAFPHPNDVCK